MKTILLYTALIASPDGSAVTKLSQEFVSKKACTDAISVDAGKDVDQTAEFPSLQLPVASRYADRNPNSNYQRWVCVPSGKPSDE